MLKREPAVSSQPIHLGGRRCLTLPIKYGLKALVSEGV